MGKREIKFRGWSEEYEKWICGFFAIHTDKNFDHCILRETLLGIEWVKVVPESVGQFAGLTDKNGKDIYEGDIIDIGQTVNGRSKFVIMDTIGRYDVRYAYDLSQRYEYDVYDLLDCFNEEKEAEIIGDIYTNPDLLK